MTPSPLILQPAAKRDIAEARSWYEARRHGLGTEFERWARANQAEIDELRRTSPDLILRQLDGLRSVADARE
jgi:hypothetical protein